MVTKVVIGVHPTEKFMPVFNEPLLWFLMQQMFTIIPTIQNIDRNSLT